MSSMLARPGDEGGPALTTRDFQAIAALMHRETGIHLADAKQAMVAGRLARRLRTLGLRNFAAYRSLIESAAGAEERGRMVAALTTNVTRFNREPHHFASLRQAVLPPLAARVRQGGRLRIWSAACSSGEEPYSIALTLLAAFPDAAQLDVRVLATDINGDMVARGRAGSYRSEALAQVPTSQRDRWFEPAGGDLWRAKPELMGLVSFRVLNLIEAWPMHGQFDAIFCRNVAIYFDAAVQARLWERLAAVTAPGGYLFIGHSERLTGATARLFEPAGITTYRRRGGTA